MNRRDILAFGLASGGLALLPRGVAATPEDVARVQRELFGGRSMTEARVKLSLPPLAENGNSVSLVVEVDSPMNENDYVKQIAIFAPRNPNPQVVRFHLTPANGRARIATRIRLGDSQTVQAVAEMNDGRLFVGRAETIVTLAACIVGG